MSSSKTKLIVCEAIIEQLRAFIPPGMTYRTLPVGLHVSPSKLRGNLQELIGEMEVDTRTILLGYGCCGQSVVGLESTGCQLVIPRVDDCIGMLLGSNAERRRQTQQSPGTYYLTESWIRDDQHVFKDYERLVARIGAKRSLDLFSRTLSHYERLALIIPMETNPSQSSIRYCERIASTFQFQFEVISGESTLLSNLISGDWNKDILVVPPGKQIKLSDFLD